MNDIVIFHHFCLAFSPKPILLNTGYSRLPYDWTPSIVDIQILRVGSLYIVGVPGELSTMAGRRLRELLTERIRELSPSDPTPHVVIAGLSNVYTHYITTFEEYSVQRYEGASTIYGPHTLRAYLENYPKLTESMLQVNKLLHMFCILISFLNYIYWKFQGTSLPEGPSPPNLLSRQFSLIGPILIDVPAVGKSFGDTVGELKGTFTVGETISAVFVSGHPRNDVMREGSFFLIERENEQGNWEVVATDADWSTK